MYDMKTEDIICVVLLICVVCIVAFCVWEIVNPPLAVTLVTDKTSYNPGEVPQFTGTVKRGTTPQVGVSVVVTLTTPTSLSVDLLAVTTNAQGQFTCNSWTADGTLPGSWNAKATSGGTASSGVAFTRTQVLEATR